MVRVDETLVYICADGLKGSLLCSVEHAQSGTAGSGKNDVSACVCLSQCQLISYYKQGKFPFDKLIRVFEFDEINEAFDASHSGKAIKALLKMR